MDRTDVSVSVSVSGQKLTDSTQETHFFGWLREVVGDGSKQAFSLKAGVSPGMVSMILSTGYWPGKEKTLIALAMAGGATADQLAAFLMRNEHMTLPWLFSGANRSSRSMSTQGLKQLRLSRSEMRRRPPTTHSDGSAAAAYTQLALKGKTRTCSTPSSGASLVRRHSTSCAVAARCTKRP